MPTELHGKITGAKKLFPVLIFREFFGKLPKNHDLTSLVQFDRAQILENSLLFSLFAGSFHLETGSLELAPPNSVL